MQQDEERSAESLDGRLPDHLHAGAEGVHDVHGTVRWGCCDVETEMTLYSEGFLSMLNLKLDGLQNFSKQDACSWCAGGIFDVLGAPQCWRDINQRGTRRLMKTSILRANNEEIHCDEHFKSCIKKGEH